MAVGSLCVEEVAYALAALDSPFRARLLLGLVYTDRPYEELFGRLAAGANALAARGLLVLGDDSQSVISELRALLTPLIEGPTLVHCSRSTGGDPGAVTFAAHEGSWLELQWKQAVRIEFADGIDRPSCANRILDFFGLTADSDGPTTGSPPALSLEAFQQALEIAARGDAREVESALRREGIEEALARPIASALAAATLRGALQRLDVAAEEVDLGAGHLVLKTDHSSWIFELQSEDLVLVHPGSRAALLAVLDSMLPGAPMNATRSRAERR